MTETLPLPGSNYPEKIPRVSVLRQLLGDTAIQFVYVTEGRGEEAEKARMGKLFPEARVEVSTFVWTIV